jgi:hypothetical protein
MIITGDTASLTFTDSEEIINSFDLDKTSKKTAGGDYRSIVAGERYDITSRFRTTAANLRSLKNLLNDGSSSYFFTPTVDSSSTLFTNLTFPLNVNITNIKIEWYNERVYYVTMMVESTSYV